MEALSAEQPTPRKSVFFDRVVEELNLDTRDAFTLLFANACALVDQRDALKAQLAACEARAYEEAAQMAWHGGAITNGYDQGRAGAAVDIRSFAAAQRKEKE